MNYDAFVSALLQEFLDLVGLFQGVGPVPDPTRRLSRLPALNPETGLTYGEGRQSSPPFRLKRAKSSTFVEWVRITVIARGSIRRI